MKDIYICSPFTSSGSMNANIIAAKEICKQVVQRGHNPIATHLYYPQFLSEDDVMERDKALRRAIHMLHLCQEVWVFGSIGGFMKEEIKAAKVGQIPIIYQPFEVKLLKHK